jgi:hypothetical protein
MSHKLVKFQKGYADEFDVYGMRLMTGKELAEYLLAAKNATYPKEMYFGTNEYVKFQNFEDVKGTLEINYISSDAAQVIQDTIGDNFGWFPEFEDY